MQTFSFGEVVGWIWIESDTVDVIQSFDRLNDLLLLRGHDMPTSSGPCSEIIRGVPQVRFHRFSS